MKFHGNVIAYGDNVDTDVIIPARYLNTIDKKELASHCMEDLDRDFQEKVKTRQIIVAGNNFGCGSSREHAPLAIKESRRADGHCQKLCPHFLPQCNQHRSGHL